MDHGEGAAEVPRRTANLPTAEFPDELLDPRRKAPVGEGIHRKIGRAEASADEDRQEKVGDEEEPTSANRRSPTPGGVRPREVQSLRRVGRPTR